MKKKVYAISSGIYEDYSIEYKMYSTKESAENACKNMQLADQWDNNYRVEEYLLSEDKVELKEPYNIIELDGYIKNNEIVINYQKLHKNVLFDERFEFWNELEETCFSLYIKVDNSKIWLFDDEIEEIIRNKMK